MSTPAGSNSARFKRQRRELVVMGPVNTSGNRISEQRIIRAFLIKKKKATCSYSMPHQFFWHNEHVPFSSCHLGGSSYEYDGTKPNNTCKSPRVGKHTVITVGGSSLHDFVTQSDLPSKFLLTLVSGSRASLSSSTTSVRESKAGSMRENRDI